MYLNISLPGGSIYILSFCFFLLILINEMHFFLYHLWGIFVDSRRDCYVTNVRITKCLIRNDCYIYDATRTHLIYDSSTRKSVYLIVIIRRNFT